MNFAEALVLADHITRMHQAQGIFSPVWRATDGEQWAVIVVNSDSNDWSGEDAEDTWHFDDKEFIVQEEERYDDGPFVAKHTTS